jgi:hypothetical protein
MMAAGESVKIRMTAVGEREKIRITASEVV